MPRRRRKRTSDTKPPLEFEESPLHIVRTVPSPVFCADNPVTADVVPVEECGKIPWVSPQFHGSPRPYLRRSKRQRFPTGNGTLQSRRKSVVWQPTQAKSVKRLRKGIVPLCFVGDNSSADPNDSDSENVSINENGEVVNDVPVPKLNDVISSRTDKKIIGANDSDEDNINQFDEPVDDISDAEAVPCVPNFDIETPPACPLNAILTPNLNVTPPSRSRNESMDKQKNSYDLTQKGPKCHKDKGRKKLVFGSDSDNNDCDLNDGKDVSFRFTVDGMPLDDTTKCDKDKVDASPKESRVKALRTIFSGVLEYTPERPKRNSNSIILAYDTPVEDQGLTERQKILKKYKKRKKKL